MSAARVPDFVRQILYLPPEGSTLAADIDALHVSIIGTTLVGSVTIGMVALYFILHYKQRSPIQLTPTVQAKPVIEAVFVGGTLGLFLMWWVIGYLQYIRMEVPPKDALLVYVVAKQWMWKFTYPDGRSTNDVLVAPVGQAVRLVMTSRDVIHSFYVPGFRLKQDVIPGRYVTAWFRSERPDEYAIDCAEYCGISHSLMRGSVLVLNQRDYDAWLGGQAKGAAGPSLAERGRKAALKHACFACHTIDGQPHIGPTWSRLYGHPVALDGGRTVVADEAYLTKSMMEPAADIVLGYKPVMPASFRYTLPPDDAAAIVDFIRSLKDGPILPASTLPALSVELTDAGPPDSGFNAFPPDAGLRSLEVQQ
jgi:cytochrome c oxidase subunit II